ncbi:MAG TPA: holo-ACP synthase [Myxococcales bacterium]|jgi:holo-[acyl-carrier protein] synthase
MARARKDARAAAAAAGTGVAGIGTDLVEVARLEKSLQRTKSFAERVFTKAERDYCGKRANSAEALAARFAAKEAFLKAVGRGILDGIPLLQIEVVNAESGEPRLELGPAARQAMRERGGTDALVTLSHAGGNAVAFVVVRR